MVPASLTPAAPKNRALRLRGCDIATSARRRQAVAPAGWLPGTALDMAGAPPLPARLLLTAVCLLLLPATDAARQLAASSDPAADAARPLSASSDPAADALLKFKDGIKDDNGALNTWLPGTRPCDGSASNWVGVMCHKGDVMGLQLENMGLSGTLDMGTLRTLTVLRSVSFMDNQFAGPFPDVKDLSGLRAVFLSGNKFSGVIPADAFDGMGSLKKVVLSKNNFSGPIPASLADVPRLLELLLNDNKFQGKIPDLPQKELKVVNVANNELEGEIPPSLKSMSADMFAGEQNIFTLPVGRLVVNDGECMYDLVVLRCRQ